MTTRDRRRPTEGRTATRSQRRCSTRRSCGAASVDSVRQARPAHDGAQPGDVRRRGRQRAHHDPVPPRPRRRDARARTSSPASSPPWLWFTVLFANFAEAMAEGRGKAQADTLRKTRAETIAHGAPRRRHDRRGAVVAARRSATCASSSAGEVIPGDGEIVEGIATVDESAITGESAPVIRESGGDRSAVTGGTRVLSDEIVVRITAEAGRDVPRPDDRPRRGRRAGRRRRTRSRSTSCSPGSRSSSCWPSSRCSRSPSTPAPSSRSSCSSPCWSA